MSPQPLPRWYWPVIIASAILLVIMAIWFPVNRAPAREPACAEHP